MDQLKIGRFIAECRKQKNLTQMQLSEKLGEGHFEASRKQDHGTQRDCFISSVHYALHTSVSNPCLLL